jgi:hypothetical protein
LKHFIVTRFHYSPNLKEVDEATTHDFLGRSRLGPKGYVLHRIQLFNQFTKPSILGQTCQDFEWLILGNPNVDVPKAKFFGENCASPLPTTMTTAYMGYIQEVTKEDELVLMTRLDNDDILMPTYVEHMQQAAKLPGLYEFLGYRLDLRNKRFYEDTVHHAECTSPFTTLASISGNLQNVYACNHTWMWNRYPLTILESREWVQVIHKSNWVLNKCSTTTTARKGKKTKIHPYVKNLVERN